MQTLLIVDDDPMVRTGLRRMTEDGGWTARCVPSGAAAVEVCSREHVDAVLIDVIMPNEDGISTMAEIRRVRPLLPVVVMSGGGRSGNADLLTFAERAGADAVLRKPFNGRQLMMALDRAAYAAIERNPGR